MSTQNERGRAAVAALPANIRVGAHDIAIVKWTPNQAAANQRLGEFSIIELEIRLKEDMPAPSEAVDTFLHELLHAVYWERRIDDEDKEERIVLAVAAALTTIFRDNPWLMVWISEALAPPGPTFGEIIMAAQREGNRMKAEAEAMANLGRDPG